MSILTANLRRELIGGFAFFAEEGITIDAGTVANDAKPDVDPPENWSDRSLGKIQAFTMRTETIDDPYDCPTAAGYYDVVDEKIVTGDFIDFTLVEHNEAIFRMLFGLGSSIIAGTAQAPMVERDRKVVGFLKLQGRAKTGTDRFVMDVWGQLRVINAPEYGKQHVSPQLQFQRLASPGNSVNFPAQV